MYRPSIHRGQLHKTLALPEKLPADYRRIFADVPCYDWWHGPNRYKGGGEFLGRFTVVVKPSQPGKLYMSGKRAKSSAHRVYVVCPTCGREVPAGRIGQHRCRPLNKKLVEQFKQDMLDGNWKSPT